MLKRQVILRWVRNILIGAAVVLISVYGWTRYELNKMYGGQTEVFEQANFNNQPERIHLRGFRYFDADSNRFVASSNIIVDHGKIVAVDDSLPGGHFDRVIEGEGQFLMPGLVDAHVHLFRSKNDLLVYLANGVTTVREMMGEDHHLRWRAENGVGPRIIVASNKVESYDRLSGQAMGYLKGNFNSSSYSSQGQLIDEISDRGFDAFKVGSLLSRRDYLAINDAWSNRSLPLIGHIPDEIGLVELLAGRQREISHVEEVVKLIAREFDESHQAGMHGDTTADRGRALRRYTESRIDELAPQLRDHHFTVVSTLWLSHSFVAQQLQLDSLLDALEIQYVNPGLRNGTVMTSRALGWYAHNNPYRFADDQTPAEREKQLHSTEDYIACHDIVFASLLRHGVSILAGTDSNIPVAVPGFTLHREMAIMAKLGMEPAEVLKSATLYPCAYLNLDCGAILSGSTANLILLPNNPLDDLEQLDRINGVINRGVYYDRMALDAMLERIDYLNNR